jgi:uncharacterized membrane protein
VADLVVIGFKNDVHRASDVLVELQELDEGWAVDLQDAVAAYRDRKGKLRIDQSVHATTGEGASWGFLWGSLIGATLAIPFTAGGSAVVAAEALAAGVFGGGALGGGAGAFGASWWKDEFGISQDFVEQVGAMIQPGDSAIYALLRTANPNAVADRFRGYGGTILSTTLTRDQEAKLEKVLETKKAA